MRIEMKRILTFLLALSLALSLTACGGKADDNKGKTDVTMTAQEILDTLKEKLGDSFDCDTNETEDSVSGYWGLDMSQVESWAAMSHSNSALDPAPPSSSRSRTATPRMPPPSCRRAMSRPSATPGCTTWTCRRSCRPGSS